MYTSEELLDTLLLVPLYSLQEFKHREATQWSMKHKGIQEKSSYNAEQEK